MDDRKFVAAQPGHHIAGRQVEQYPRHRADQQVSRGVAEMIVYILEVIKIDIQQSEGSTGEIELGLLAAKAPVEQRTIG